MYAYKKMLFVKWHPQRHEILFIVPKYLMVKKMLVFVSDKCSNNVM